MYKVFAGSAALATISLTVGCQPKKVTQDDAGTLAWDVTNPEWTPQIEAEFGNWVRQIGIGARAGKCGSLMRCLTNPEVNPLYDPNIPEDKNLNAYSDCADAPYQMRGYFAFKKKLPFVVGLVEKQNGIYKVLWTLNQREVKTLNTLFSKITNIVSADFLRTPPDDLKSDTYPVMPSRDSIKPGTTYYDPAGHVAMVYDVEDDGTIRFVEGHPQDKDDKEGKGYFDTNIFDTSFGRGKPGGGFRAWRPYKVANGELVRTTNAELKDFSADAQYKDNYCNEAVAASSLDKSCYYGWVRQKVARGGKPKPVEFVRDKLTDLCGTINVRVSQVNTALRAGAPKQSHPTAWPADFVRAWDEHLTFAGDQKKRIALSEMYFHINNSVKNISAFDWKGSVADLVNAYKAELNKANEQCKFSYINSKGATVPLTLFAFIDRAYDISFDPYHCPELRWGAKPGHPEYDAAACESNGGLPWYQKEQRIRWTLERQSRPIPIDADFLATQPTPLNIKALLDSLSAK